MRLFNREETAPPSDCQYDKITYTLDVEEYESVDDVKYKLEIKTTVPANQMRFIFNGKQLSDDHTLNYYHIDHFSTIHWFPRLRGD